MPASTRPRRESLGTARGLVDGLAWSKAGATADKRKVVEPGHGTSGFDTASARDTQWSAAKASQSMNGDELWGECQRECARTGLPPQVECFRRISSECAHRRGVSSRAKGGGGRGAIEVCDYRVQRIEKVVCELWYVSQRARRGPGYANYLLLTVGTQAPVPPTSYVKETVEHSQKHIETETPDRGELGDRTALVGST